MSARSLNKVRLIGNLTRDPELRYTPKQVQVAAFGLATNREWSGPNGEKQQSVEYHNLVAWQKLADICQKYLHKGDKIYVEGRLQTRDWVGKDGNSRRSTEVIVENMIMLNRAGGGSSSSYSPEPDYSANAPTASVVPSETVDEGGEMPMDDESDIPF